MQVQSPFMVSYGITTKCNPKCKHCYSESVDQAAPDELSTIEACRNIGLPFQLNEDMLRLALDLGTNGAEAFDLVAAERAKPECQHLVLSLDDRKQVAACHCSRDGTRRVFRQQYGEDYTDSGVGKVITVP